MIKTEAQLKLERLTQVMKQTLKTWNSPGGQPTLPDVAASMSAWKGDLQILSYHDETNGPSFQKARAKMEEAWDNRDNRDVAIETVEEALGALEGMPEEMESPEFVKSYRRRNIKSLYGEDIARYDSDPHVFGELYEIRRQVSGFSSASSPDHIDHTNLVRVKSALMDITERYDSMNPINSYGHRAVKSLTMADNSRRQPARMRQYFSNALQALDEMGAHADLHHAPVGYKATLIDNADEALDAVEAMQDLMYTQPFYSPAEFMPKALKAVEWVIDSVEPFYDPKASRMAQAVKSLLLESNESAGSYRVKSLGFNAWQFDGVSNPFNAAVNKLDALDRHIRNL